MTTKIACRNCRYFYPLPDSVIVFGECRVKSPQWEEESFQGYFATMQEGQWCGQFLSEDGSTFNDLYRKGELKNDQND